MVGKRGTTGHKKIKSSKGNKDNLNVAFFFNSTGWIIMMSAISQKCRYSGNLDWEGRRLESRGTADPALRPTSTPEEDNVNTVNHSPVYSLRVHDKHQSWVRRKRRHLCRITRTRLLCS
jgi:hypothetical protein